MAATLVILLTFVSAWIVHRSATRHGWLLDALAFSPIAVPSVIVGASVLFAYLMLPIPVYNTIWILLIAYITLFLPYGMRFATSGITQIHRELEEAAEMAGAHPVQVFVRVLLPLMAPVIFSAWLYVFVLAVRELSASVFLIGPGTQCARHDQPHHVGGRRQLWRGLCAGRHSNLAAYSTSWLVYAGSSG